MAKKFIIQIMRIYYKIVCKHDFYMDKQITMIKCSKCGYKNWLLNRGTVNLFPNGYNKPNKIESQLHSKTLFDN
jgi:DNA-directed RNA polymerase subunit RPC12/RpoP